MLLLRYENNHLFIPLAHEAAMFHFGDPVFRLGIGRSGHSTTLKNETGTNHHVRYSGEQSG